MRGFGMIKPGEVAWLEHPAPECGPMDAILKPVAVAICSSDTHCSDGGAGPIEDRIMGHESVGEIVEVGQMVTRFKPGDKVVVNCVTPDWEAVGLQERDINNGHDHGLMGSLKLMLAGDGCFAELYKVNNADANLVLLPEGVDLADALMTTDMMSTGFYAAEMAEVAFGDTVVIFGIGPVGLMATMGTALSGAGRIICIGTRPNCVELAKEFGATDIVSYKEGDIVEQIMGLVGGQVDKCIIAGGTCASLNQALMLTKPNGIISTVNFYDATDSFQVPAPLTGLGMSDVTIRGGFCPGGARRTERLLNVIKYRGVHPGKIGNMRYEGFESIPEAFRVMHEKPADLIKTYVVM